MNIETAKLAGYKKIYFTFDCIGDTILLMSALKYLFQQSKQKILVGTNYKELVKNCEYLEVLDDFCEDNFCSANYNKLLTNDITPIFISSTDFVQENGMFRPVWGKNHILANVCSKLGINAQIEILPNLFLSAKEKEYGRFFESSQIAIVSGGNQQYKSIPFDVAQSVVNNLKYRYNFVQVGSISDPPLEGVLDKRTHGEVRDVASILYNSDVFIGGIGGLMHMARAVGCRAVIAFSVAEPLCLENYVCNINIFAPDPKCSLCGENKSFPFLTKCRNQYSCISGIRSADIENAIEIQMNRKNTPLETEVFYVKANAVSGVEDYLKRFNKIKESGDNGVNNNTCI